MEKKFARVAVLVSGGGTNLQAILDAQAAGRISSGRVVLVLANNPNAFALERARRAGVATAVVTRKEAGSQEAFEDRILEALAAAEIDLIVLAGFMAILSQRFTDRDDHRILNVHPSLIPSFCGAGF